MQIIGAVLQCIVMKSGKQNECMRVYLSKQKVYPNVEGINGNKGFLVLTNCCHLQIISSLHAVVQLKALIEFLYTDVKFILSVVYPITSVFAVKSQVEVPKCENRRNIEHKKGQMIIVLKRQQTTIQCSQCSGAAIFSLLLTHFFEEMLPFFCTQKFIVKCDLRCHKNKPHLQH